VTFMLATHDVQQTICRDRWTASICWTGSRLAQDAESALVARRRHAHPAPFSDAGAILNCLLCACFSIFSNFFFDV
jgi:hypothetical protein